GGRSASLHFGGIHPRRHAGAGGCHQCPNGVGPRRRYSPALHDRFRLRHNARSLRGRDDRTNSVGSTGHGRYGPDPCLRRHRDRRHRLNARRIPGRAADRPGRYAGPLICDRYPAAGDAALTGPHGRSGHRVDVDLRVDGTGPLFSTFRSVSGTRSRMNQTLAASGTLASRQSDRVGGLPAVIFLLLALVPFVAGFGPESYVLGLFTRVMVFAIAALALDFICGYGGLVSFGHAAFVGIGAYAVGILGAHGITDMLVSLPV